MKMSKKRSCFKVHKSANGLKTTAVAKISDVLAITVSTKYNEIERTLEDLQYLWTLTFLSIFHISMDLKKISVNKAYSKAWKVQLFRHFYRIWYNIWWVLCSNERWVVCWNNVDQIYQHQSITRQYLKKAVRGRYLFKWMQLESNPQSLSS